MQVRVGGRPPRALDQGRQALVVQSRHRHQPLL